MKRACIFFSLFLCFLPTATMSAQDVAAYFVSMSGDLLPELEVNRRKDLIDLYREGQPAKLKNSLNGELVLERLTPDYLLLRSDSSSLQVILLNMINDSHMICTIETRCAPVCDSRIGFYTIDWKPLDENLFLRPVAADWFLKEGSEPDDPKRIIARSSLDLDLMEFRFNPDTKVLEQRYNTPDYLNKEDYEYIKPYLKQEPKLYHWKQIRFE